MRRQNPQSPWTLVILAASLLFSPFAASQSSGPPSVPGKLVDIGGRRLHINSVGKGGPTVVLEAGAGDFSLDWSLVLSKVAQFTRVCAYDRAGYAWSDPGPTPRTMQQIAYELHEGLHNAGIKGPYVLVGHSLGGLILRVFAARFPDEVAGMVLVDSTHEDTKLSIGNPGDPKSFKIVRLRDMTRGRAIPAVQQKAAPATISSASENPVSDDERPKVEPPFDKLPPAVQKMRLWAMSRPRWGEARGSEFDYLPEEMTLMRQDRNQHPYPLGDKPLIVLGGAKEEGSPPGASSDDEGRQLREEKLQQKKDLAALSRNSRFILDYSSGHHIQLDDPDLVVSAIRQVAEAIRNHQRLDGGSG